LTNDKEYTNAWYAKNKLRIRERKARERQAYVIKRKKFLDEQKSKPCLDCKIQYPPYVMDFDHRNPAEKEFEISSARYSISEVRLLIEISKCDLVCANCHRIRTFQGLAQK
jgi:hypothetical protein